MKFHLVPIGEKFTFKGEVYTKSGPIAASPEASGASRMIARSANVSLCNIIEPIEDTVVSKKLVPLNEVVNVINNYNAQYSEHIEHLDNNFSESSLDNFKRQIETLSDEVQEKLSKL